MASITLCSPSSLRAATAHPGLLFSSTSPVQCCTDRFLIEKYTQKSYLDSTDLAPTFYHILDWVLFPFLGTDRLYIGKAESFVHFEL
jgi:hypothetical protein